MCCVLLSFRSPMDPSCIQPSNAQPPSNGQRRLARPAGREGRQRAKLEPGVPEPKGGSEPPPGPVDPGAEDGPLGPGTQEGGSSEGPPTPEPRVACPSEARNTDATKELQLHGPPGKHLVCRVETEL